MIVYAMSGMSILDIKYILSKLLGKFSKEGWGVSFTRLSMIYQILFLGIEGIRSRILKYKGNNMNNLGNKEIL